MTTNWIGAGQIACPHCHAQPGQPCVGEYGDPLTWAPAPHQPSAGCRMTDGRKVFLIRPVRGTYVNDSGYARWLKPHIRHGAWVIGPDTPERLAYVRKYTDQIVDTLPEPLLAAHQKSGRHETYFTPERLIELGWRMPEPPSTRLGRWWQRFLSDAGAYR